MKVYELRLLVVTAIFIPVCVVSRCKDWRISLIKQHQ
nr:MAG TPA: hypothetical protein [Caudoviricetes sp.]